MRSTRCGCYKCAMGTQGLSGREVFGGRGGNNAPWRRIAALALPLAILPLAAGCSGSSFPSFGSSNSQTAAVPPPPNSSVPPAGQPAYAPPPGQAAYAPQAQAGGAQPGSYAAAPPAQAASQGTTVGSLTSSYVSFLKALRDPEPDQQSLNGPSNGTTPPQQNAYIPHPPSTYVPSGQPYAPPQAQQPVYAAPTGQQNYAAPPAQPNAPGSGQQSSATSSAKQAKATRASSQQNAAAAPPSAQPAYAAAAAPATAAPPAQHDYSDSMPYPKQSLTDLFRDSTQPQGQTVPSPPSTYSASGQPYTPQGQAAGATAAAAPPPANPDPSASLPYPKQSLFEVFSSNK